MLKIVIVLALFAASYADEKTHVYFAPSVLTEIVNAIEKCGTSKHPPTKLIELIETGKYLTDDPEFEKTLYCAFKTAGFTTPEGSVHMEKSANAFPNPDEIIKIMKACEHSTGDNEKDTYNFYRCFQDSAPVNIHINS